VTNIVDRRKLVGVEAYVWAFKRRAQRHHCIGYGTFQVELDELERARKRYSRAIAPITHTAVVVKATALALQQNPEANAILFKAPLGYRIVRFDDVDVNVPVTRMLDGAPFTFLLTVRGAAKKTLQAIQQEITDAQRVPPERSPAIVRIKRFAKLPLWLARVFHEGMRRSPKLYLKNAGTCGLTIMEGPWGDFFFPIGPTSVVFSIGGTRPEAVVRDGAIVARRMMKVCLGVDNYVVPGPVGAKLAYDFKETLERARFVDDEIAASPSRAPAAPALAS
jgi:pyruvate/2-oxoglutarate dehydrogenase complex dihydrolipoamide acyltransferase (E2) component